MKYIGSHKGTLDDGYIGSGYRFMNAYKKYGIENFQRTILYIGDDFREFEYNLLMSVNASKNPMYYNLVNNSCGWGLGEDNWIVKNKGHSEESKNKIRKTLNYLYTNNLKKRNKGLLSGNKNPMYGKSNHTHGLKKHSAFSKGKTFEEIHGEEKAAQLKIQFSISRTGKKHILKELKCPHCCLIGAGPNMARYHFDKCYLNIEFDNNKVYSFSSIEKVIIKCPHCNLEGYNMGNMKRWHFDKCKHKGITL
jgi:hypothetical protein